MPARTMLDSTTPDVLPHWPHVKAFYIDGQYSATAEQIAAWHGPRLLINVTGDPTHGGDMLDVENGDATPASIPAWFDARHAAGIARPGVYSDRDQFGACTQALAGRVAARWLATLDGTIVNRFDGEDLDAVQFAGASELGFNGDVSLIFRDDFCPGRPGHLPNDTYDLLKQQLNRLQDQLATHRATVLAL